MSDSFTKFLSLEDELAQRAHQQAVVAQLGQRALKGVDLYRLMDEAVQLVAQTLDVEYCKVLELLPGEKALLLKAGVGWKDGLVGQATVGSDLDSQAGYTLYSSEPVIVEDLGTEERFRGPDLLVEHRVVSGISVIIQGNPQPYGVMGAHTTFRRSFTKDDVHFLLSVANVLGTAIERKRFEAALVTLNADLEKRVLERAGYVRLLQEVAVAANQADSVDTAFQFVLDQVCTQMNWPVGHVYLTSKGLQGNQPELIPTPLWHLKSPQHYQEFRKLTMETVLAPGVGLPGQVYVSGEPDWFTDLARSPNFPRFPAAVRNGIKAGFAFPVLVGEEVVAVLEFYTEQVTEPEPQLLEVMGNIGTQLGRVVERQRAQKMLLRSNEELRKSQGQLAEAQKIAHIGSWDWDIPANTLHWSEELYRIYGLDPVNFNATYEGYLERIHPDDREAVAQIVENAYRTGQPFKMEHRSQLPDGAVRTIYAEGRPVFDESGKVVRMLGIGQDITGRRQIEDALRKSLVMLENLFELAPDGTVLIDEDGSILRMNRQMEQMFGYARAELIGQPLEILLPERFKDIHALHRSRLSQDPDLRSMGNRLELFARRKDGSEFPVDIILSPLQTEGEVQLIAVVRDISERRQAEEAVHQSEARFRSIFEGAALGIAVVDLERRILVSNPRLAEMLGYTAGELRGKDKSVFTHPLDLPATLDLYEELIQGRRDTAQLQKRVIHKDGRVIWGALTISLIRDAQGDPLFVVSMVEEITSRKQMEAELAEVQYRLMAGREQERMQLAQELHDVPLQDLYVLLYQLNEMEEAAGDPEQLMELKNAQAEGLRQIITTLRSICGELRSPTLSPFGLEGAIREHAESFQLKHPQIDIQLELKHDDQDLEEDVRLNLFRIYQQAVNNVIRHAQASEVTVRFSYDEKQVVLEIKDNGQGFVVPSRWIGLARQGHLGLVGAAERAEMIGGSFKVSSTPGKGTLVRVVVPRIRTTE